MLLVERWTRSHEHTEDGGEPSGPTGLLIPIGIDLLLDGLLVGIAFAAGATEGVLLSVALSFELLSLGLALTIELSRTGASTARAILIPVGLALATLVSGAVLGSTVLANASEAVLATVLAFGCAALLFLVTEELLVEAHEVGETPWTTSMFFLGFLGLMILGML
jgi:ZIP family zinc transporter